MKRKITLYVFMALSLVFSQNAMAYDFLSVSPSGHTLYYSINGAGVSVVGPSGDIYNPWTGYTMPTGNVIIPDSVTYMEVVLPVTEIGHSAFMGCSEITSVVIPDGVTIINTWAFYDCSGLTTFNWPASLVYDGNHGLDFSFYNCTSLTSVVIPDNLVYLYNTFGGCTNLTSVTIGSSLRYLHNTFQGCHIKNLVIRSNAYSQLYENINQDSLQTVILEGNATNIPDNAFSNATHLQKVTLGPGITSIGANAFRFCTSLDTIFALPDTAPTLGENAFQGTPSTKVVVTTCNADYASVWGDAGFSYTTGGFTLTLSSNNTAYGTASFVQPVDCQQTAIIQAVPATNCAFIDWSDGDTNNPRTITLTHNTSLVANFAKTQSVVTLQSNNELWGEVAGGGTYTVGIEVPLSAIATCGYRFAHWQDGGTSNPRTFVVPIADTILTAYFELNSDTVVVHDTTIETQYVDVYVHDTTVIHDTALVDVYVHDTTIVHDTTLVNVYVHDTTTVHDTISMNVYVHDTTAVHDTTYVHVHDTTTVYSTDTLWLTLYDTIYLPQYIHDTIYIHDTVYITEEGIADVAALNAKVYSSQGQIVVEGAEGNSVTLYDVNGRMLATKRDDYSPLRFDAPASGTYMIKIGNYPARKVAVVR